MTDGNSGRRRFLRAVGVAGAAAIAGCTGGESADASPDPTTETDTPTRTTEEPSPTPTEQATTTTARETVEDLRQRRADLTAAEKREQYRSGIPSVDDYELDYDRVQEENDTRREQLIDITATVGDQYTEWVDGNHAVMHAVSELDWMGWAGARRPTAFS